MLSLYNRLPQGHALAVERRCKSALKSAGVRPVQGHEYFDVRALPLILRTMMSML